MSYSRLLAVTVGVLLLVAGGLCTPAVPEAETGQFVKTQSGKTICDVLTGEVACEYPPGFMHAPQAAATGRPFNMAIVNASGAFKWVAGDIGTSYPNPEIVLNYGQTYQVKGWTIQPSFDDTRFTNDSTGHGMFVTIESVSPF